MSLNPANLTLRIQSVSQSFYQPLLLRICSSLELRLIQNNRSRSEVQLPKNELRSVILSILIRLISGVWVWRTRVLWKCFLFEVGQIEWESKFWYLKSIELNISVSINNNLRYLLEMSAEDLTFYFGESVNP